MIHLAIWPQYTNVADRYTGQTGQRSRSIGWRLGVMASVVRRMNEVTVHWARLVLGWVTVFGRVYHHDV